MSLKKTTIFVLFSLLLTAFVQAKSSTSVHFSGSQLLEKYGSSMSIQELESHFSLVDREAYNPWEKKTDTYSGILVTDLVDKFSHNRATKLKLFAIDRYTIIFTRSEWKQDELLLVTKINGKYLTIADKGPLKLIYTNFDESKLEHKIAMSKWIWMVKQIELY